MEVVVEVAAVRGVPGERPAHPLAERGELLVRRPGHRDQRGVAHVQLPQPADPVGGGGAARAALVPVRAEHEVVHHQLRPALEQVEQADRPVRALERVRLVHPDHRQPAAVGVDPVAGPGQLLLLRQQFLAGGEPLLARHHLGQVAHRCHGDAVPVATMGHGATVRDGHAHWGRRGAAGSSLPTGARLSLELVPAAGRTRAPRSIPGAVLPARRVGRRGRAARGVRRCRIRRRDVEVRSTYVAAAAAGRRATGAFGRHRPGAAGGALGVAVSSQPPTRSAARRFTPGSCAAWEVLDGPSGRRGAEPARTLPIRPEP